MTIETMNSGGMNRFAYLNGSPEFYTQIADLPFKINPDVLTSISSPQYSSIYNDTIVSTIFKVHPTYLKHLNPSAVGRKYFLNKGWVYDKVYQYTCATTCLLPSPIGSMPLYIGYLVNVYGQLGDTDFSHYKCLYFYHQDHAVVEAWADTKLISGTYSTFYAATFDTLDNNKLLRMKSYAYDEQGAFSDWDVMWMIHTKKATLGLLSKI